MADTDGRAFYKMCGSGNDFVFFDVRHSSAGVLETPEWIRRLSARATGVGADGVVFLDRSETADIAIRYYNSDGSVASLCGNATLCTASLAVQLGAVDPHEFRIATGSGLVGARIRDGVPEIDFPVVEDPEPAYVPIHPDPGERRLGYATAGVPHVVIEVGDVQKVDVVGRGRPLRSHPSLPHGANVNFVARRPDGRWDIRTYERGVEGETLACGSGNVASAVLLRLWGEVEDDVELVTRSGKTLGVRLAEATVGWYPALRGEGRLVFEGRLATL